LTIAGSDCSAGAGLQADLKTFTALGTYGVTVVTCVVSEVPGVVSQIGPVDPALVGDQIKQLFAHLPVRAAKTGMLYSAVHIAAVNAYLPEGVPLVVDPVMVASNGAPLLLPDAVDRYRRTLLPRATVITPNLDEAAHLTGRTVANEDDLEAAARELANTFRTAVLVKGGHLKGDVATDVLVTANGIERFSAPYVHGISTHGTGCTYSAAITAGLARGKPLRDAVAAAKDFVTDAIRHHHRWGAIDALDQTRRPGSPPAGNP
jgi:hydroxymethylpyrimidine/phosphomethylpyrimidine kinase